MDSASRERGRQYIPPLSFINGNCVKIEDMRTMFYAKYSIVNQITKRGTYFNGPARRCLLIITFIVNTIYDPIGIHDFVYIYILKVCVSTLLKAHPQNRQSVSCIPPFKLEMARSSCYNDYTQISRWLFFVGAMMSSGMRLESRDAVFVNNSHRRYNVSKVAMLRNDGYYYLPPSAPISPEVIDNRNVVAGTMNETGNYSNMLLYSSRVPAREGSQDTRSPGSTGLPRQHHRRPTFLQSRRQTTPRSPPSPRPVETPTSFANHINVEEMSCQNAGDELFFRASIKASRNLAPPVIDNAMREACQAMAVGNSYRINLERDQVWNCGVVECSMDGDRSYYCLELRFPVISGLRLRDDYRVTLRCKTQDRIAYHTRRISVKTLEVKARNVPSMLNGGSKNALDVDVGLFRKTYNSENIFDTRIQSGGTVVLGEEILLRVLVNGDDGWRHSKIGQVTMHYEEERQQQRIVNSLWILNEDGCLNSDVREICPQEQYKASPLESHLIFQAFMFEGMRETDEISLAVKATACFEPADCVLDCPAGHVRRARNVPDRNNTVEWQDDIVLRVSLPKRESRAAQNYYLAILLSTMALIALMILTKIVKTTLRRRTIKS